MRSIRIGIVAVGLTAGSCGAYWGAIQYQGNFHTVEEAAFYRSAQLGKDELQAAIREHQIRSVLNLRGAHPGQAWYDEELAVSQALGVQSIRNMFVMGLLVLGMPQEPPGGLWPN